MKSFYPGRLRHILVALDPPAECTGCAEENAAHRGVDPESRGEADQGNSCNTMVD